MYFSKSDMESYPKITITPDNIVNFIKNKIFKSHHFIEVTSKNNIFYVYSIVLNYYGFQNKTWYLYSLDISSKQLVNFYYPRDTFKLILPPLFINSIYDCYISKKFIGYIELPHDILNIIRKFLY